jgi:hypothetical protein
VRGIRLIIQVNRIFTTMKILKVLPARPSDKVRLEICLSFRKDGERRLFERAAESRHLALSWDS